MQHRRRLIWVPLALAGALTAALIAALIAPASFAQGREAPHPAPYSYFDRDPQLGRRIGPELYFAPPGVGNGAGQCYYDSLSGRVCRD